MILAQCCGRPTVEAVGGSQCVECGTWYTPDGERRATDPQDVPQTIEMETMPARLDAALDEAERKAWDSLARYKFQMFGYWAGVWVHLNRIAGEKRPNPWCELVRVARMSPDARNLEALAR